MISIDRVFDLSIDEVWDLYAKHINPKQVELIGSFPFGREAVSHAIGSWIFLKSGRKILDITGGIGVLTHGHNHEEILKARIDFQRKNRMEVHKNFFSPYTAALSHNVAEMIEDNLVYSYFPNSGAEAVEGAIKLAYKYHGGLRDYVLHSDISFHGKLLGSAGLTGSPELHFKYPTIPNVRSFGFNDRYSFDSLIDGIRKSDDSSNVYAVIVEPLNASSMKEANPDFLLHLRNRCTKENIPLIFDEVYTGWGKTGWLFNYKRVPNLRPDILTYAKAFGGGKSSISGYSYNAEMAKAYSSLRDAPLHSTTYYGFGEEAFTALMATEIIRRDNYVKRARDIGNLLGGILKSILDNCDYVTEIRGSGALWGVIINDEKRRSSIEIVQSVLKRIGVRTDIIVDDPRFAQKLLVGAIVNSLYEEADIVSYFGYNKENPLMISLPLVSGGEEIAFLEQGLKKVFQKKIDYHIINFVKSKFKAPKF